MMRTLFATYLIALSAGTGFAQDSTSVVFEGAVEDAVFAIESAIVNHGLVIDYTSHVGEMMARTGADLDLGPSPVGPDAQVFLFCSATVSREVMEADPMNIANCPYGVFLAEIDGETMIGRRIYSEPSMAPVNALLEEIVAEAAE